MKEKPTPKVTCTISKTFNEVQMCMTILPSVELVGASFENQFKAVNQAVTENIEKYAPEACVIQQTVFLRNYEDRHVCQKLWKDLYGANLPLNVYVPQPPCEGQALGVEVLARVCASIEYKSENLVKLKHSGVTWYCVRQQEPEDSLWSMYSQTVGMFQGLDRVLTTQDIPFENVVRTWLYLGNITEPTYSNFEGETQRYKELNRARTDFFRDIRFFDGVTESPWTHAVYPASTGIGADGDTLVMSALAVKFDDPASGTIIPLENPHQTSAFDYGEQYSIKSPKFARALLLASRDAGIIFVSGTASIINQETWYPNDVEKQTELSLDNIEVLIDEKNLAAHGRPGFGCALSELVSVRVYIKRKEDYEKVRAVCERRIPNVAKIYTFADICRPDLLVEIEGTADVGPACQIERK